jgi:hypothetical protein
MAVPGSGFAKGDERPGRPEPLSKSTTCSGALLWKPFTHRTIQVRSRISTVVVQIIKETFCVTVRTERKTIRV